MICIVIMNEYNLIEKAVEGDKGSLNQLLELHQSFIFNVALKMLNDITDTQDVTQEVLIKVMTNLSKYDPNKARFTTWVYRITCNHILNFRNSCWERQNVNFENFFEFMEQIPDLPLNNEETEFMGRDIEEVKITCTSGMLMCLDREQRMIYILGDLFRVDQALAAEALDLTPGNFRIKLTRARKDLHSWMHKKCGLVNENNPCRCRNKTKKLIETGEVDPANRKWLSSFEHRIKSKVSSQKEHFASSKEQIIDRIYSEHPYKTNLKAQEILDEITKNEDFTNFMNL